MINKYIVLFKCGNLYIMESDWYHKDMAQLRQRELKASNPNGEYYVYSKVIK